MAAHVELLMVLSTLNRFKPQTIQQLCALSGSTVFSPKRFNDSTVQRFNCLLRDDCYLTLEGSMEKEHLEMILEDISGKFDLVLEGHAALDRKLEARFDQLNEKIEDNSFKIDILNNKIDAVDAKLSNKIDDVAAELQAHRSDTEVHRGYQVRED